MEIDVEQRSVEWKRLRGEGVTGTEVAAILGLNHDVTRKKLIVQKVTGEEGVFSPVTQNLMFLGTEFERVAKAQYERSYSLFPMKTPGMFRHRKVPFLTGSPDLVSDPTGPGPRLLVEIKTHFYPALLEARPIESVEKIPLKYYTQVQTYLEILEMDAGVLFSWTINQGHALYRITRDPVLWGQILPVVTKFQEDVIRTRELGLDSPEGSKIVNSQKMAAGTKDYWLGLVWASLRANTVKLV
jgi:putative phage-type endonuclease